MPKEISDSDVKKLHEVMSSILSNGDGTMFAIKHDKENEIESIALVTNDQNYIDFILSLVGILRSNQKTTVGAVTSVN